MNVLQAQIKPHFMYNSLDTIRWMAEEHNEEDIVEIVENAIYHGIKEKRGNGKIIIKAKAENDHLCFTVIDNGKGIEEDKLNKINNMLKDSNEKKNEMGYGIFNVNVRIKLIYRNEYGLTYKSIYGEGTTVEFRHPIVEAE